MTSKPVLPVPMQGNPHARNLTICAEDQGKRSLALEAVAEFDIAAQAEEGGEGKPPRFKMVANTGGKMELGWGHPVVVDLDNLEVPSQNRPVRLQHSPDTGVGHTESVDIKAGKLRAEGVVSRSTEAARDVVESARLGFPWQVSIGATVKDWEYIPEGKTVKANGRTFKGPLFFVSKSTLGELSFVDLGADQNTSAKIAANATEGGEGGADSGTNTDPTPNPVQASSAAEQLRAEAAAEATRIAAAHESLKDHPGLLASAISERWSEDRIELEKLKASRPAAADVNLSIPNNEMTPEILEAAFGMAAGVGRRGTTTLEASYGADVVQKAHDLTKGRGLSLQQMFLEVAAANGWHGRGFRGNEREILEAAFGRGGNRQVTAALSQADISGILSNTANKFLLAGWMGVEQVWRRITNVRPVTDFKTVTSYRLTGVEQYEQLNPGGNIKHGTLGEQSYTNKADTYALMLSLDRTDIINDDLGALDGIPRKLGRGAGLKVNDVFWTAFLDNAAFWTAGNGSYFDGSPASVLGVDALTTAEQMFMDQTDPDGNPVGIVPAFLLVPTALSVTARKLHTDTELRDTTASTKSLTGNPHSGKFEPLTSAYLGQSGRTNSSQTAWHLLADPDDMPVIETAFLNGQEEPVIESADLDFNKLGVQFRGYHDFGVAKQEYRGGVKAKGAA